MESVSRSPIYTHFGETITGDPDYTDSTDVHRDINLMVMSTTTISDNNKINRGADH